MEEICIMVSEISALAGRNKYYTCEKAIDEHMVKYEKKYIDNIKKKYVEENINKENYQIIKKIKPDLPEKNDNISYKEYMHELQENKPEIFEKIEYQEINIEKEVDKTKTIKEKSDIIINEMIDKFEFQEKISNEEIISFNKKVNEATEDTNITNIVKNMYPMIRGIKKEINVYDFLRENGYEVLDLQKAFYKNFKIKDINVTIYGKVDGIYYLNDKPSGIIEIKNRINNFFIPSYDLDQLATYLMISGHNNIVLVQSLNKQYNITTYNIAELQKRWLDIINSDTLYKNLKEIINLKNNNNNIPNLNIYF